MSRAGRHVKLTKQVADQILTALRDGNYLETASSLAGIDPGSLRNWIRRGKRETRGRFHNFATQVDLAMAEAESRLLRRLDNVEEWTAIAWRLERRWPDHWGRRQRVDANIKANVEVTAYGAYRDVDRELAELLERHHVSGEALAALVGEVAGEVAEEPDEDA